MPKDRMPTLEEELNRTISENEEEDLILNSLSSTANQHTENTSFSYPNLSNQLLGPYFYCSSVIVILLILFTIFISPSLSLLLFIGILPACILFLIIYFLFKTRINFELSLEILWSGICSIIPVFIFEITITILFIFLFYSFNIIKINDLTKFNNSNFIEFIKMIELQIEELPIYLKVIYGFLQAFIIASLIEEMTKTILSLRITSNIHFIFKPNNSNLNNNNLGSGNNNYSLHHYFYHSNYHPLPPMIYSMMSALGLSTIENIGHIIITYLKINSYQTVDNYNKEILNLKIGSIITFSRIGLALPLHVLTGCLIGLRIVQYKIRVETLQLTEVPLFMSRNNTLTNSGGVRSFLKRCWINIHFFIYVISLPVLYHGLYDFILLLNMNGFISILLCVLIDILLLINVGNLYNKNLTSWSDLTALNTMRILDDTSTDEDDGEEQLPTIAFREEELQAMNVTTDNNNKVKNEQKVIVEKNNNVAPVQQQNDNNNNNLNLVDNIV
ncbi:hypothetical protein ABK040_002453 [Willaertia magna]